MRFIPHSLKNRILLAIFLVAFLVFSLTETLILAESHRSLVKVSDKTAEAYALGLASLLEVERDGTIDLESTSKLTRDSTGRNPGIYSLILRISDNSEIERSESLRHVSLSLPQFSKPIPQGKPVFWNTDIDGKKARFVALRESVQPEPPDLEEDDISPETYLRESIRQGFQANLPRYEFLFIVGMDNSLITKRMGEIFEITAPALGVGLLLTLLLCWIAVDHSLKPLRRLEQEVQPISASNMTPVTVPDVKEVAAVSLTLNRALSSLREAFDRERRFTSTVAHELRTPISEIRTLSEVALRRPSRLDKNSRKNYEDILASAKQMQGTVCSLLTIARCQSGNLRLRKEVIELKPFILSTWKDYEEIAAGKSIKPHYNVSSGSIVTDKDSLQIILHNLFSNAVNYTPTGGEIRWSLDTNENRFILSISNSVKDLTDYDLHCLFEPFWRKDEARTPDDNHSGLGLSLVQSLSSALGLIVNAQLTTPTILTITLAGETLLARSSFSEP